MAWLGKAGVDGQARSGLARRGVARSGVAGEASRGLVWLGRAWLGMARQAWQGEARHGTVGLGMAGEASRGGECWGKARSAGLGRHGVLRSGEAWPGTARQAWKQTTDDHETSFVIMNKRPPTNSA